MDDIEDDSVPSSRLTNVEFRPEAKVTIGYTEEVVVSGTADSETVIAKTDTGACRTSLDTEIAAAIGAGPVQTTVTVRSATASSSRTRPVVDVVIGIGGTRHTVAASIEDRSDMNYPVLLGRDVLSEYTVDVEKRANEPGSEEESATHR